MCKPASSRPTAVSQLSTILLITHDVVYGDVACSVISSSPCTYSFCRRVRDTVRSDYVHNMGGLFMKGS